MIINQRDDRHAAVIEAGRRMMTAIRTAPKARGVDIIETILVEGEELKALSEAMLEVHQLTGRPVYQRDAANILNGDAVILIGSPIQPMGLNCAHCGYATCGEKPDAVPCAMNSVDIGIAIGSACALAAAEHIDTRVMFSVGMGAMHSNLMPGCRGIIAIALSATSKSPFFDRK